MEALIKNLKEKNKTALHIVYQESFDKDHIIIPEDWSPIPKLGKDHRKLNRILIVAKKLAKYLEDREIFPANQEGFRPGKCSFPVDCYSTHGKNSGLAAWELEVYSSPAHSGPTPRLVALAKSLTCAHQGPDWTHAGRRWAHIESSQSNTAKTGGSIPMVLSHQSRQSRLSKHYG